MSVTYKGVRNGGLTVDNTGNVSTTRKLVYLYTASESPVTILQDTNIPRIGTAHPQDSTIYLTSIGISDPAEGDEKRGKYEVTLTYTRSVSVNNVRSQTKAPWKDDPYDISVYPITYERAFQKAYDTTDAQGNPSIAVLNAAGDPFEENTAYSNLGIRFSYNLETFDFNWATLYTNTINDSSITVIDYEIPAKYGLLRGVSANRQKTYDSTGDLEYEYWKVDVEIEVSAFGFTRSFIERGLYALKTASTIASKYRIWTVNSAGTASFGTKEEMMAVDSELAEPVDEPQKLAADGTLYTSLDGAIYASFEDKYAANWGELTFPGTRLNSYNKML